MRDLFINGFEILVGVIVVILAVAVVAVAGLAAFGNAGMMGPNAPSGPLAGLAILVGGALYVLFVGGLMYLGLGIYQNTRRTAFAMEKLATR